MLKDMQNRKIGAFEDSEIVGLTGRAKDENGKKQPFRELMRLEIQNKA
jgi:hypothetical protein